MPIFSEISRRFHMLTTDVIPDPPRKEPTSYTHNLEPDDRNTKTKTKSNPTPQFEQNDVTSTEESKSLSNNAIPTNTCSSKTEQDFNDTKSSSTDEKQHKKPNVKTKTKSKQSKYPQGANVVNYNIINSNGVKIGARTSYICNVNQFPTESTKSWSKSKIREMSVEVERLSACTKEITLDDIFIIKTHIGRGWRDVARRLLYSDGQIEQFEENYRFRGISEVVYQIFLDWKQANTTDAKLGSLINELWTCQEYDCAERLASAHMGSA
ncbi:protein immune deficiency-like isoform X1 [Hylaeus anthracinus]|uniref:protein immune deficiency-like isoform X1 n=1 Tax=Hylaeus anthracinus TaxID=313031 RepID=UPI0023B8F776|nr:protein immune deficiency-like isoform X1 [Hylaeus anthracinus]XP_054009112.1 protein immune deficiency-like isoform X1 [Hylaeus anthracinus]XP_054009113.1 protein immune deficiency-like isoform X1 [Hylaeus anthracinus]XP_054009114.1 protein immune deficiency-like isoform X1 [Hylaeus anthracinus]XP_054010616.1 protein immune deficiency-like isoform X1 [Hylaeus anthracinus]